MSEFVTTVVPVRRHTRGIALVVVAVFLMTLVVLATPSSNVRAWPIANTRALALSGFSGGDAGVVDVEVDTDADLNTYVMGKTGGTVQVDPSNPSTVVGNGSVYVRFISKYSLAGTRLWTVQWPVMNDELILEDLEVTPSGEVVAVGHLTGGLDLDPGDGVVIPTDPAAGIILKLDTNGKYQWHREMSSTSAVWFRQAEVATDGSIIVGGNFESTASLDGPGGANLPSLTALSSRDGVVISLSSSGVDQWAAHIKGPSAEEIGGLDISPNGNISVAYSLKGATQLIGSSGAVAATVNNGAPNFGSFVWQLTSTGEHAWATVVAAGTSADQSPNLYGAVLSRVSGEILVGVERQYVYVLSSAGSVTQTLTFGARTIDEMDELSSGKVKFVGNYSVTTDLDPTTGTDFRTPNGSGTNGFVTTLNATLGYESTQVITSLASSTMTSIAALPDGGWAIGGYAGPVNIELAGQTFSPAAGADSLMYFVGYNADGSTTVPTTSAPTTLSYTPGNKKVTLSWTAMPNATRYVVTNSSGVSVCDTATTTCDVTGLRNGRATTFSVVAYNAIGVASTTATSVRAMAGFTLGVSTVKVRKRLTLTRIVSTPSRGKKTWRVTSGKCRISGSKLVAPTKRGRCTVELRVAKRGSYPAMKTSIRVTVTR